MLTRYDDALAPATVNRSRLHPAAPSGLSTRHPTVPQLRASARQQGTASTGDSVVLKKLAPDAPGARRLTTVEMISDERPMPHGEQWVRIAYGEAELRARVKEAGRQWDGKRKLWRLSRATVRKLTGRTRRCQEMPADGNPYLSNYGPSSPYMTMTVGGYVTLAVSSRHYSTRGNEA